MAAYAVRKQLRDLSHKIGPTLQPVSCVRNWGTEIEPLFVNKQGVVYHFSCDLCDADYVGFTARHLHQPIAEHKNSATGRNLLGPDYMSRAGPVSRTGVSLPESWHVC